MKRQKYDWVFEKVGTPGERISFRMVNGRGEFDPTAMNESAYPKTVTRISQGRNQYADSELPFAVDAQDDWSGGRGSTQFRDDTSKFLDNWNTNTSVAGSLFLGPQEHYGWYDTDDWNTASVPSIRDHVMPGDMNGIMCLLNTNRYCTKFTANGTKAYTVTSVDLWVRTVGSPTAKTINVGIYSDNTGVPDTLLGGGNTGLQFTDGRWQKLSVGINVPLTGGTTYWVAAWNASGGSSTDHVQVGAGVDETALIGGIVSAGPNSGGEAEYPYFALRASSEADKAKYFIYKGGSYCVLSDDSTTGNALLLINGDRGVADSNAGNLDKLIDASKSWRVNAFAGATVVVTNGTGSEEKYTYRTITSNTATALTVDSNWRIQHDTTTEYVIVGSDYWYKVGTATLAGPVTDVVATNDYVYFAFGSYTGDPLGRYEWYASGGAEADRYASESMMEGSYLLALKNPDDLDQTLLYIANNNNAVSPATVYKAMVPPMWGDLFWSDDVIADTKRGWYDGSLESVLLQTMGTTDLQGEELTIGTGAGASTIGAKYLAIKDVAAAPNVRGIKGLGVVAKKTSNLDTNTVLRWHLDPDVSYEAYNTPASVLFLDASVRPAQVVYYDGTTHHRITNLENNNPNFGKSRSSMGTAHYLYVGYEKRFDTIGFTFTSVNSTASVMDVEYWNGDSWTSVNTLSDGTALAGAAFGQDGTVTHNIQATWTKGPDSTPYSTSYYYLRFSFSVALDNFQITNIKLENTEDYGSEALWNVRDLLRLRDGDKDSVELLQDIDDDDYLYIGHTAKYDEINFDISNGNTQAATMTVQYWDGSGWTSVRNKSDGTVSASASFAIGGSVTFDISHAWLPSTINNVSGYWTRISFSVDLDTNTRVDEIDVRLHASEETVLSTALTTSYTWNVLSAPALTSEVGSELHGLSVYSKASMGNSEQVSFRGKLRLVNYWFPAINLPDKINALVAYGSELKNPWVITTSQVYEIQTQAADAVLPIPLEEVKALASSINGMAATQADVYLWFNLGRFLQRYFDRTLDDAGPDQGEGLPDHRQGDIVKVLAYPGRLFAVVSPTPTKTERYSSILVRRGGSWTEVWRGAVHDPILDIGIQVVPGPNPDRLWVFTNQQMLWLPLPSNTFNPLHDASYTYAPEGHLITAWFDIGYLSLDKLFKSVRLHTKNLSVNGGDNAVLGVTHVGVKVQYQLNTEGTIDPDAEGATWTDLETEYYTSSPFEEINLAAAENITGYRIRFRLILVTNDASISPVVNAFVLTSLLNVDDKRSIVINVSAEDYETNLWGVRDYNATAVSLYDKLRSFVSVPPIILRVVESPYNLYDGMKVTMQPPGVRPYVLSRTREVEKFFLQLQLIEV